MNAAESSRRYPKMAAPDFTRDLDLSLAELNCLLELTAHVKRDPQQYSRSLAGRGA